MIARSAGAAPLFALTAYAKNEQDDLSQDDRNQLRRLIGLLLDEYRERH